MTTHTRQTTNSARSERAEWVVEAATGRVVRREAALLLHRVVDSVSEGLREAAMNIESDEADSRVVRAIEDSRTVTSPTPAHPRRPGEAGARLDGRTLNRDHRGA